MKPPTPLHPSDRIIVALDVRSAEDAYPIIEQIAPHVQAVKVGLGLITSGHHRAVINRAHNLRMKVFLDGKFHDTPRTVADAARDAADLGVWMFDVHCSGGIPMMEAAVANRGSALVLGVTVLTSLSDIEAFDTFGRPTGDKVQQFTYMAARAGLDGFICSPQELSIVRRNVQFVDLIAVTPGVRPWWAPLKGQARFMTPAKAVAAGADYLIIGSPITEPTLTIGTRADAAKRIIDEFAFTRVDI